MRWTLRRMRRWLPEQWAIIPALWLAFGAVPFALFIALGPFGTPAPHLQARRLGPIPAAVLPRPDPMDRLHNLWPDRLAPVYYPPAVMSVEFQGGTVGRVELVSQ